MFCTHKGATTISLNELMSLLRQPQVLTQGNEAGRQDGATFLGRESLHCMEQLQSKKNQVGREFIQDSILMVTFLLFFPDCIPPLSVWPTIQGAWQGATARGARSGRALFTLAIIISAPLTRFPSHKAKCLLTPIEPG